jgi:hypothetical protein
MDDPHRHAWSPFEVLAAWFDDESQLSRVSWVRHCESCTLLERRYTEDNHPPPGEQDILGATWHDPRVDDPRVS